MIIYCTYTIMYCQFQHTVLIEIIVFPSLHLNKNASSLMIRNDLFTGTVSALMPLSTQYKICIRYNMKV